MPVFQYLLFVIESVVCKCLCEFLAHISHNLPERCLTTKLNWIWWPILQGLSKLVTRRLLWSLIQLAGPVSVIKCTFVTLDRGLAVVWFNCDCRWNYTLYSYILLITVQTCTILKSEHFEDKIGSTVVDWSKWDIWRRTSTQSMRILTARWPAPKLPKDSEYLKILDHMKLLKKLNNI